MTKFRQRHPGFYYGTLSLLTVAACVAASLVLKKAPAIPGYIEWLVILVGCGLIFYLLVRFDRFNRLKEASRAPRRERGEQDERLVLWKSML